MIVKSIEIKNFRNIKYADLLFCNGVNIIYGENAQGKTNILEALWLFTGTKSFRGTKDSDQIKFGEQKSSLKTNFFAENRSQCAEIQIEEKKSVYLNEIKRTSITAFNGKFPAVIFSPEHLFLVKGGPYERRKFIDNALCQIKPSFNEFLTKYKKNLLQRNALLKKFEKNKNLSVMLDIFEENLAHIGTKIIYQRKKYLEVLEKEAKEVYRGISSNKEEISIEYINDNQIIGKNEKETEKIYAEKLLKSRSEDILTGTTSVGPHRDDINIKVNGISARKFGSQGQQRSCVLALKLGEAAVLKEKNGEQPIALLDDVMSELDESRQDYILHKISGWQVFITCCEPETILKLKGGKTFKAENGKITEAEKK